MFTFSRNSKDKEKFKKEIILISDANYKITNGIYSKDILDAEMREWEDAAIDDFLAFDEMD